MSTGSRPDTATLMCPENLTSPMQIFQLAGLGEKLPAPRASYREFLRIPSMSCGVYSLPAGSYDPQVPHNEDEIYYATSGEGRVRVGSEDQPVRPGTIVFVPKGEEHNFHSITEDLVLLMLFSPAETTARE